MATLSDSQYRRWVRYAKRQKTLNASGSCAYRRAIHSVLPLEKAPRNFFESNSSRSMHTSSDSASLRLCTSDLLKEHDTDYTIGMRKLFIIRLNLDTSKQEANQPLKPLDGVLWARVKTRTDPKGPGQILRTEWFCGTSNESTSSARSSPPGLVIA